MPLRIACTRARARAKPPNFIFFSYTCRRSYPDLAHLIFLGKLAAGCRLPGSVFAVHFGGATCASIWILQCGLVGHFICASCAMFSYASICFPLLDDKQQLWLAPLRARCKP